MNLIEIKILNYQILLPLSEKETVASISEAALQEYYKLNLKQPPQKVLYTCDTQGRILSGGLPLPLPSSSSYLSPSSLPPSDKGGRSHEILEVKVENYSDKDIIPIHTIIPLYRQWQFYLLAQMKEYLQYLSYRETPLPPETKILTLIKEISRIPNQTIQLTCINLYKLLLTKFPQLPIIQQAVEQLCRMFLSTNQRIIGLTILKIFDELSPLQMKLFQSVKYMKLMLDVEHHLFRFHGSNSRRRGDEENEEEEGEGEMEGEEKKEGEDGRETSEQRKRREMKEMFLLFEKIISLLQDEELNELYRTNKQQYDLMIESGSAKEEEKKVMRELLDEEFDEEVAIYKQKFHPSSDVPTHSSTSPTTAFLENGDASGGESTGPLTKKWNISRLQALVLSDDQKIRNFSLENLKKLLQSTYEASLRSIEEDLNGRAAPVVTAIERSELEGETNQELSRKLSNQEAEKKQSSRVGTPRKLSESEKTTVSLNEGKKESRKSSAATVSNSTLERDHQSSKASVALPTSATNRDLSGPLVKASSTGSATATHAASAKILTFTDEQQYMQLVKTLMQALQKAIKGRNQEKTQRKQPSSTIEQLNQLSTAGRLAYIAMKSPETDLPSVQLIMECLCLLFYFPLEYIQSYSPSDNPVKRALKSKFPHLSRVPREFEVIMPSSIIQSYSYYAHFNPPSSSSSSPDQKTAFSFNPLTGDYLSLIQTWFLVTIKEFYRLLFTLSHCTEYYQLFPDYYHLHPQYELFVSLSERSAFFFNMILFYSSSIGSSFSAAEVLGKGEGGSVPPLPPPNGWKYCQLPLEKVTIKHHLLSDKPNYRVFMTLTYLIHVIKKQLLVANTLNHPSETQTTTLPKTLTTRRMKSIETLDDLHEYFQYDSYSLVNSVWAWTISKKSNLFLRRLALQVLSKLLVINDISYYLWKLDPIPRLLELLTKSFRMKNQIVSERHPHYEQLRKREEEKKRHRQERRRIQRSNQQTSKASLTSIANSEQDDASVILICRHASLLQADDCYYQSYTGTNPRSVPTETVTEPAAVMGGGEDEYDDENIDKNTELLSDNESIGSNGSHESIGSAADDNDDDSSVNLEDFDLNDFDSEYSDNPRPSSQQPPHPPPSRSTHLRPKNIAIEWKLVKLVLKSMLNLLQATISKEYFSAANRVQLLEYLQNLKIGKETPASHSHHPDHHYQQRPQKRKYREYYRLMEVIHQKQEISFYYKMIVEQCEAAKRQLEADAAAADPAGPKTPNFFDFGK